MAGELASASFIPTREWFSALLVFAIVHVVFHLVLTVHREVAKKKRKVRDVAFIKLLTFPHRE